jgi:Tfp pilus assembly PilM family ATPase
MALTVAVRLPLGLDLGSSRVRLARAERSGSGAQITAVATRDLPEDALAAQSANGLELVSAIVEDLRHELGGRERRCVLSMNVPAASLRFVRFPNMGAAERRRAAAFDAQGLSERDADGAVAVVRVHPAGNGNGVYAVGIASKAMLSVRTSCAKRSGLVPVAVDHDVLAFRRSFPNHPAVLDVGLHRATLHAFTPDGPVSVSIPSAGLDITRAIGSELSIDATAAEKRKRTLGTAGAGEGSRDGFVLRIKSAVQSARERAPLRRIALVGNGSRLIGLAAALESAIGATAETAISKIFDGSAYPADVVRAGAPDWTLAASLAIWGHATDAV